MNIANETIEAVARAIARAADADYWIEEVDNWFALDEPERDVADYPDMAFEERDNFRNQARAALKVAAPFAAARALRDAAREAEEDALTTAGEVVKDLRRTADKLEARA